MDIEEAKIKLLSIKQQNESKSMRINNNISDIRIRWSENDYKNMAAIQQQALAENRAIETVLSELDKKDKIINAMAKEMNKNYPDDIIANFTKKVEG